MKKSYYYRILLGIALALLGGCRSAPVYNVEQAAIVVPPRARLADVRQAIVRGAMRAGWRAKPVQEGKIIATYSAKRGRLQAVVDIDYDIDSYDITYRSSHNLKFREIEPKAVADGQDDNFFADYNPFANPDMNPFGGEKSEGGTISRSNATIHKAYNQWVRQLQEKINLELAKLPMRSAQKPAASAESGGEKRAPAAAATVYSCADTPDQFLNGQVVVTKSSANVRSGIGTRCSVLSRLNRGDVVSLVGSKGNWYNITTAAGLSAWVYAPLVSRASGETQQPIAPGKKISIAVIQFKTLNKEAQDIALGDLVSETFTSALVNSSIFKITEREQLDKVIKEMEMNQTGFIETTDAVEIGKMLHADAIITGSVALLGNQIQLNARVIDIESAYVISAETKTSSYSLSNINKMVNEIVARLAARFHNE